MIFGDVQRFAIQSEAYALSRGNLLGHICLRVNNKRLGSCQQNVLLQNPVIFMKDFLAYKGERNHFTFEGKPNDQILEMVHWALYSDGEDSDIENFYKPYRKYDDVYLNCEICPRLSPSFDGSQAVLLNFHGMSKLIWKDFEDEAISEIDLNLGECEAVMKSFIDWVATESNSQ